MHSSILFLLKLLTFYISTYYNLPPQFLKIIKTSINYVDFLHSIFSNEKNEWNPKNISNLVNYWLWFDLIILTWQKYLRHGMYICIIYNYGGRDKNYYNLCFWTPLYTPLIKEPHKNTIKFPILHNTWNHYASLAIFFASQINTRILTRNKLFIFLMKPYLEKKDFSGCNWF